MSNQDRDGMGNPGAEQLLWLADDLKERDASTTIVVFAHIPLRWRRGSGRSPRLSVEAVDTNDKFSIAFDKSGDYAYFCGVHPHLKGKIIVAP